MAAIQPQKRILKTAECLWTVLKAYEHILNINYLTKLIIILRFCYNYDNLLKRAILQ